MDEGRSHSDCIQIFYDLEIDTRKGRVIMEPQLEKGMEDQNKVENKV